MSNQMTTRVTVPLHNPLGVALYHKAAELT